MNVNVNLKDISYSLFRIVNNWFGSEEIIRNRRMIRDIFAKIFQNNAKGLAVDHLLSGSRAEGFRFATSDQDIMLVYTAVTVLTEINPSYRRLEKETLLLMETNQTRPGFSLLRLVSISRYKPIVLSLVQFQNELYVSSALWRNVTLEGIPGSQIHGPCESGWMGGLETDFARCLKCMKWPICALPSVKKLLNANWPSIRVLSSIIQSGCHLVAVGDKTSDKEIMEWRISFSQAENVLIDEMNHCQFLCYGLLKVFLKEAIETNENIKGLLCSYFMKTSVFWAITQYGSSWLTEDILRWFWICFRQVLNWVCNGYCPNFFIPENNMFFGKIYGRSQQLLITHLVALHTEGYLCFLRCPSLGNDIDATIREPQIAHLLFSDYTRIKVKRDLDFISELSDNCSISLKIPDLYRTVTLLENAKGKCGTFAEYYATDVLLRYHIQYFLLCSLPDPSTAINNSRYKALNGIPKALKQNRVDAITHNVLSAIILYRMENYPRVIKLGSNIMRSLKQRNMMYIWGFKNRKYIAEGGDILPLDAMMKSIVSLPFRIEDATCISELSLEERSSEYSIYCPPMAIVCALLFLSFYKSSMYSEADSILQDLAVSIHRTDNHHIPSFLRAISWEILGICQEMGGYLHDACHSFQRALMETLHNYFREATLIRLHMLDARITRNYINPISDAL